MAVDPLELALLDEARMLKFYKKILRTERASLIGFWPLWEASGSVATDISGNGRNGSHVAVTLGQPGIGDGRTCPLYDGSTSYTNVYSAALAAAFNGDEGTLLIRAKVANAGVWTDGAHRFAVSIAAAVAVNGTLSLYKHSTLNVMRLEYTAGGVNKYIASTVQPSTFFSLVGTWSASENTAKLYLNGSQSGAVTGIGVWAGAPAATKTALGSSDTTPSNPWSGWLAHCALWSKALTAAQIAYLSKA